MPQMRCRSADKRVADPTRQFIGKSSHCLARAGAQTKDTTEGKDGSKLGYLETPGAQQLPRSSEPRQRLTFERGRTDGIRSARPHPRAQRVEQPRDSAPKRDPRCAARQQPCLGRSDAVVVRSSCEVRQIFRMSETQKMIGSTSQCRSQQNQLPVQQMHRCSGRAPHPGSSASLQSFGPTTQAATCVESFAGRHAAH